MPNKFVQSGYDRIKDDDYQTIDKRCIQALVDSVRLHGIIVDCCANQGSGIVDELIEKGFDAKCGVNAFQDVILADFGVTNPPYVRGYVDQILNRQIQRVADKQHRGFFALLRANFDFAKGRKEMFADNKFYVGQIKMCFRPIWVEPVEGEKKVEPIHNFVWHWWSNETHGKDKIVRYWYEK